MGKIKDDKGLYGDGFYDRETSPALAAAARALYGRLNFYRDDLPSFGDLDVDTYDHYVIAARHAIRAFYREAEKPV